MFLSMKMLTSQFAGSQMALVPRRLAAVSRRAVVTKAAAERKKENVSKADLIEKVAATGVLTPKQAQVAVNTVLQAIVNTVANGEKVVIPGFGTFEQRVRAARKGRNPRTGEALDIPESKSPAFSAGKTFKDAVKGISKEAISKE